MKTNTSNIEHDKIETEILNEFFIAHKKMIENLHKKSKQDLIDIAIKQVQNKSNCVPYLLEVIANKISFPEISFTHNDTEILIPTLDPSNTVTVSPSLYYKDDYNNHAIDFYTLKFNTLLKESKHEVTIFETSEFYESEEEDDEYEGLPMFEAFIQDENEDALDDSTTGRYCSLSCVIEEIENSVEEFISQD